MAYVPTEWVTGDVITAAKLNKAENGIAANSKVVYTSKWEEIDGVPTLVSGTFQDAVEVMEAGGIVIASIANDGYVANYISTEYVNGEIHMLRFYAQGTSILTAGASWSSTGLGPWPSAMPG